MRKTSKFISVLLSVLLLTGTLFTFTAFANDDTTLIETEEVDKTAEEMYDLLRSVIPLKPLWTTSTWNSFEKAYTNAWVAFTTSVSQEEFNAAYNALAEASASLERSSNTWLNFVHDLLLFIIDLAGGVFEDALFGILEP